MRLQHLTTSSHTATTSHTTRPDLSRSVPYGCHPTNEGFLIKGQFPRFFNQLNLLAPPGLERTGGAVSRNKKTIEHRPRYTDCAADVGDVPGSLTCATKEV